MLRCIVTRKNRMFVFSLQRLCKTLPIRKRFNGSEELRKNINTPYSYRVPECFCGHFNQTFLRRRCEHTACDCATSGLVTPVSAVVTRSDPSPVVTQLSCPVKGSSATPSSHPIGEPTPAAPHVVIS